jgi:hypothetical protein
MTEMDAPLVVVAASQLDELLEMSRHLADRLEDSDQTKSIVRALIAEMRVRCCFDKVG